jgi:nucleotide-binding universal stress UspA family protein
MKIVLCADGSDSSTKALRWAAQYAMNSKYELMVLHVVKEIVPEGDDLSWYSEENKKARKLLEDAKTLVGKEFPGVSVITRLEEGEAAKTIVELAEKEKFDSIVLGSRGLGNFDRLLLGSVAQKVSVQAPCPVTIVR